jgi:hypothetical protein
MRRIAALVVPVFLCACGASLLQEMDRLAADPTVETPRVSSFIEELTCGIEWTADPAADAVLVERAADASTPVYEVIYSGPDTSYTDTDRTDQGRYLYRLRKVKGDRTFDASESVLGIGSATCRDSLEPNDAEDSATPLEYDRSANMYFYRSYSGAVIQDDDWYSVSIPPRRTAHIVITQDGLGGGAINTYMYFYLKGSPRIPVINNQDIPINNTSYETITYLFKVYPNPDEFISDPTLAGGTVIGYTVSLNSITQL